MIIYRRIGKPMWPKWYEVQFWAIDLRVTWECDKGTLALADEVVPVGYCALRVRETGDAWTDVFVEEAYRKRGIGSELKRQALAHAFGKQNAKRAVTYTNRMNHASIGSILKQGYRYVRCDDEGQFHFELTREKWAGYEKVTLPDDSPNAPTDSYGTGDNSRG